MASVTYEKGLDELEDGDAFKTFGISLLLDGKLDHTNQICVYGDEAMRDRILAFLQIEGSAVLSELVATDTLTKADLANALDAFWNAAIGRVRHSDAGTTACDTVGAMAEGFAAVAAELRKEVA